MTPASDQTEAIRTLLSRMPPKGQSIVAASASAGWDGVHAVLLEGPIEDFFDISAPFPVVLFILKGSAQLDWRRGSRFSRLAIRPGDVLITPRGDANRIRSLQPIEVLFVPIEPVCLAGIVARGWPSNGAPFEIVEGLNRDDEAFWDLGNRLADRLRDPRPGSRQYAEALQTQIAIHLLWHYSSLAAPGTVLDGLADGRLRPVIDYIRENLTEDVSLETLAGVAGLSPNYFLGAFREATGRTPHRYVTELRVARACELLRDPHRSITEVSLAVGFSSQSHLTEVFRRTMKTTPAAYRREVLGLSRSTDEPES